MPQTASEARDQAALTLEKNLFREISWNNKQFTNADDSFRADVKLVGELLTFLVGARETPLVKTKLISQLVEQPVYLKMEDYLLPGGSAKGRAVFGLILQDVRTYIAANPDIVEELANNPEPLGELLRRTYNDSEIVANSAGNHGISVAAVFNNLKEQYGIKTKVVVYVPESAPTFKLQRIINAGAEIVKYGPDKNRDQLISDHAVQVQKADKSRKVFLFPTEPNKARSGGFAGLATEATEILRQVAKVEAKAKESVGSLFDEQFWKVRSPTSSGPTFGGLLKVLDLGFVVQAIQDYRNGHFVVRLLELHSKGELELSDKDVAKLKVLKAQIRPGSPENGGSTKKVNALTEAELVKNKRLQISVDDIRLVPESVMKLASALIYIETLDQGTGGILPEKIGSVAVGSIIAEKLGIEGFARKLAGVVNSSKLSIAEFIEMSGLTAEELSTLQLADLGTYERQKFPSKSARVQGEPIVAVVSGANRDQPFEIALRKHLTGEKEAAEVDLLQEFAKAAPKTILEILHRTEKRTIADEAGKLVTYHSGDDMVNAIYNVGKVNKHHIRLDAIKDRDLNDALSILQRLQDGLKNISGAKARE